MIVDLDSLTSPRKWQTKVCILGGGIAGLILAHSLRRKNIPVVLLEAGGLQLEPRCQDLNRAEMAGLPHLGTSTGRCRILGGASNQWGGQLMPFTPDVFEAPPVCDLPHWPITSEDLEPYFHQIQLLMGVNSLPFTDDLLNAFQQRTPFTSDDIRIRFSKWLPHRNRNLSKTLGQQCIDSSYISVFLHACATRIALREDGGSVKSVTAKTMNGLTHEFEADLFVVCAGTIETSRLLLASGVGNDHDQVGRYFHDHISVEAAAIQPLQQERILRHFTPLLRNGTSHTVKLEASTALRARHRLLSVMAHFTFEEPEDTALHSVRTILRSLQAGKLDSGLVRTALKILPQSLEMGRYLKTAYLSNRRPVSTGARVILKIDTEQKPHAESRIKLSKQQDRLGSPIARVNWRISEEERRAVQTFAGVLDAVFRDAGLGTLAFDKRIFRDDDSWFSLPMDVMHMMGGTRMGFCPSTSVVNENLQVHGVENLYVASCSVFPTGGCSNPTFSLMALTLRLSDLIVKECSAGTPHHTRHALAETIG
jgi:choline dehydrogenase-like flavoprotein